VQAALLAGAAAAERPLIERRQIARVHPTVLQAISQTVDIPPSQLKVPRVIELSPRPASLKWPTRRQSANVHPAQSPSRHGPRGKGFVVMAGDVASVQAAVAAGCKAAAEDGMLVGKGVIANPSPELFKEYI